MMTAARNLLALPVIALAIGLWFVSDNLAKLSMLVGEGATRIVGPER